MRKATEGKREEDQYRLFSYVTCRRRTTEVSDHRRRERWSVNDASKLQPDFERRSGAAVRFHCLVRLRVSHT